MIDNRAPFLNPGFGDTVVVHIADYDTPDKTDYSSASIGNDPGTLIAAGLDPPAIVSVDISAALQQILNLNSTFILAFRIQNTVETDFDGLNDAFFFMSAEAANTSFRPFVEFGVSAVPEPTSLVLLAIGLAGLGFRRQQFGPVPS